MKVIDNKLFITWGEMVTAGISESALKKAKYRQSASWFFINDNSDNRKVLIGYEQLSERYKEMLSNCYGNVYEYAAAELIDRFLVTKEKDIETIRNYMYGDGKYLPISYQNSYILACGYLGLADRVGKREAVDMGFGSKGDFNKALLALIKGRKVALPASERKFYEKVKQYGEVGAIAVISGKFGNQNTRKVGCEMEQMALLEELCGNPNNWGYAKIRNKYNQAVRKHNATIVDASQHWKEISNSTVRNYMSDNGKVRFVAMPGRKGSLAWRSEFGLINKLTKPSNVLYYSEVDGWTAELAYQVRNAKGIVTYHNRKKIILVIDGFNNYPLGYAIVDGETVEGIKNAWRNAASHAKELFGDYYRFGQVKSDRFGLKQMTNFYDAISRLFSPAKVGVPNSKGIEAKFSYLNRKYCNEYENWTGVNIVQGKKNQPNFEFKNNIKKNFPDEQGVIAQIQEIIAMERAELISAYMAGFEQLSAADKDKFRISREDYLLTFGRETGFTRKLSGHGLTATINGMELHFDSFTKRLRYLSHVDWEILYDESDMSTALAVNEDRTLRELVSLKIESSKAIYDQTPEEVLEMQRRSNLEKQWKTDIAEHRANNMDVLKMAGLEDAVMLLKAPITDSTGNHKKNLESGREKVQSTFEKDIIVSAKMDDYDIWSEEEEVGNGLAMI